MSAGELTPFEFHGMQPVLAIPDVEETVAFYKDVLGFHVDFVHGDPPVHARVCADPAHSSPTVHIRFEPLERGTSVNPSVYLLSCCFSPRVRPYRLDCSRISGLVGGALGLLGPFVVACTRGRKRAAICWAAEVCGRGWRRQLDS